MFNLHYLSKKTPCKNCENRFVGCHNECNKYKEYRKEIEKIYEVLNKDKLIITANRINSKFNPWATHRKF